MPTINQLPAVSTLTAGDNFPIYSPSSGDARRVSATTLMAFVNANLVAEYSTTPVTKTSDFTLGDTETEVIVNKSGSSCVVTLPVASAWIGRIVWFRTIQAQTLVSASSNVVPLAGGAAGTAILAATAGKWAKLVSDGANWQIMAAA